MNTEKIKTTLSNFAKPFKPLGKAFVVFAKTSTGKTIGIAILVVIVASSTFNLVHKDRHRSHHRGQRISHHYQDIIQSEEVDLFQDIERKLAHHRSSLFHTLQMTQRDISAMMQERAQNTSQTIAKTIINNEQSLSYSLNIQENEIQGQFSGQDNKQIIQKLSELENIDIQDNTFSLPYSLENIEKVITILESKTEQVEFPQT